MEHTNAVGAITYEPFTAGFTGTLTTYVDRSGVRWQLSKPYLKVQRGQRFMIAVDAGHKSCRFLPLLMPGVSWQR